MLRPGNYEKLFLQGSGVRLHAAAAGPPDGPLVILLHGFPEFWYGWRKQMAGLADAGFRVVAPDGRGYNLSDKPPRIADYRIDILAADAIAVADALGRRQFSLAGHDWGAAVAWTVAQTYAGRVSRLAILNVPHPAEAARRLTTDPRQMLRSWYMLFFQSPRIPEFLLSRNNFAGLAESMIRSSRPGTFSAQDIGYYRAAWSKPGALRGMLNWYRALRYARRVNTADIDVPVRILWGERDRFLVREMAEGSMRHCRQGDLFRFPGATHWLQHEEPGRVNRILIEFFSGAVQSLP